MAQAPLIPFDYLERQKRRASVQREIDDPIAKAMGVMRDEQVRSIIHQSPGPDLTAKVTIAARETGEPPALIEDRLPDIERAQQANRMTAVLGKYPAFTRWAQDNPRGVAAAADDHKSLGMLGEAWDWLKGIGASNFRGLDVQGAKVNAGLADFAGEAWDALNSFASPNTQTVGQVEARKADRRAYWMGGASRAQVALDKAKPTATSYAGKMANEALGGLAPSMLPSLAGVVTGSPSLAITLMGVGTGIPAYTDARVGGKGVVDSARYGFTQGAIESITEKLPASSLIEAIAKKTPIGKTIIRQLGQEIPGEQVATILQDFSTWATLNPEKPFSAYVAERPQAALDTLIQTAVGTTAQTSLTVAVDRSVNAAAKVAGRVEQSRVAKQHGTFFDKAGKAAEQSKLRERDPEAYAAAIREQANDTGAKFVYIPGEAAQAYMQSDAYDPDGDPFSAWAEEAGEAYASGGDLVIPIEQALTSLPGSPAWAALKDDMRLVAGGISAREAQTFDDAIAEVMGGMTDQMAAQDEQEAKGRTVRQKLLDSVAGMLSTGYTSPVARSLAELAVSRVEARAGRKGQELTGNEFDNLEIRTVLPESVALAKSADSLDLTINAMRGGKPIGRQSGPTLTEWIAKRGGINDSGGDIASMGGDKWHKGKVGRRKLIRPFDPQASMGGITGAGDYGADTILRAAVSEGFFPELAGMDVQSLDTGVLLDALASEFGGQPRYASEVVTDTARAAADDLRQYLEAQGYNPDEMGDGDIRALIQAGEGQSDQAGYEQEAKGRIIFDGPRRIIELFQSRNLSTAIHEFGHMWLEELAFDATTSEASDQIKADWETVKAWFAANGHALGDNGTIPVEAHELWARGIERYVMEGKAPSTGMKRLFETFRTWMLSIYKTVEALRTPITPEIRGVMDRLLATDEQIAAMREEQALSALFNNAADIGMSEAEFAAYREQVADARAEAQGKVLEKAMRSERAKATKEYRDARKNVRADVEADVLSRPMFRAFDLLKTQPMDSGWIRDEMGEDALALLPKRVPPVYTDGGVNPSTIAEMAGYATGKQMIEALIGAEITHRQMKEGGDQRTLRNRMIDTETDAEMNRRYGDPLNDGSIEREALAAVHNDKQGEVIASELRVLARTTGNRPTPYAMAREWARGRVRGGVVAVEASPGAIERYRRAAAKAGRLAETAMLERNVDEAFRQKQLQMLNNALVSEAKTAADEVEAAVKRLGKIGARRTMKSVDQDYLEQAQALLEAVDLKRRSQKGIERKKQFEKWAAAKREAGEEVYIPERFNYEGTEWTRLTVEEILGLRDTVESILHLGKVKQGLLDRKERRDFEEWKTEALALLNETPGRKVTTELGDPSRPIAGLFSNLMKMEIFAAEMDNDTRDGSFQRLLVQRATDNANHRDEMRDRVLVPIAAAYNALPRKERNRLAERVVLPEIPFRSADLNDPRIGEPLVITRWEVVGMALNMGTASNLDKLARGYSVSQAVIEDIVMRELTADEWLFVQTVWNNLASLRPEIAKVEREMQGVEPEWVEPRQVVTPYGVLEGGYYPVIYDPSQSQRAEDNLNNAADDLFGSKSGVNTAKGHTQTRTNYAAPMLLSPEAVIFQHVEKIITRNAYAPWVRDVLKVVKDPSIRASIDRKFGQEFRQQIEPWLRAQVREGVTNEKATRFAERFARAARVNTTIVSMGLRWSTGVAQTVGLANSIGRIGVGGIRRGFAKMLSNPSAAMEFVFSRSPEMARRNEAMNRDVSEAFREMRRVRTDSGLLNEAARLKARANAYAFWHIGMIDRWMVSMPTWLGAYENAIRDGMDDVTASAYADKQVRLSQGSGREKDLAAVQSGQASEFQKFFTMFYTPFNVLLNVQWEAARGARRGDWRKAAMLTFWFMIATPLLDAMLSGDVPDDDDEEAWSSWLARNIGFYLFAGVPVVRDAANYAERKVSGQFSTISAGPIARVLGAVEETGKDAWKAIDGDEEASDKWVRHAIETPGYFLGLPTGQVSQTTQFLWDVSNGNADPEGFQDWYVGLTKGRLPDQ